MLGLPDKEKLEEFLDLYRRLVVAMERMADQLEPTEEEEEDDE